MCYPNDHYDADPGYYPEEYVTRPCSECGSYGFHDKLCSHNPNDPMNVMERSIGLKCEWCDELKENPLGMCGKCGRFPKVSLTTNVV